MTRQSKNIDHINMMLPVYAGASDPEGFSFNKQCEVFFGGNKMQ